MYYLRCCVTHRYMKHFKEDSKIGLNLRDLKPQLPAATATADGTAPWLSSAPPLLVIGTENDFIVDEQ
jgi:hypothetical protein